MLPESRRPRPLAPPRQPRYAARGLSMTALFTATVLLGAGLLFLVQPMVGKRLLPPLGAAPAVWNTCLVFFQAVLLAGYAYAHGAAAFLSLRRRLALHAALVLVPLSVLPLAGVASAPPAAGRTPRGGCCWSFSGRSACRSSCSRRAGRSCRAGSPARPTRVRRLPGSSSRRATSGAWWRSSPTPRSSSPSCRCRSRARVVERLRGLRRARSRLRLADLAVASRDGGHGRERSPRARRGLGPAGRAVDRARRRALQPDARRHDAPRDRRGLAPAALGAAALALPPHLRRGLQPRLRAGDEGGRSPAPDAGAARGHPDDRRAGHPARPVRAAPPAAVHRGRDGLPRAAGAVPARGRAPHGLLPGDRLRRDAGRSRERARRPRGVRRRRRVPDRDRARVRPATAAGAGARDASSPGPRRGGARWPGRSPSRSCSGATAWKPARASTRLSSRCRPSSPTPSRAGPGRSRSPSP